MGFNSWYALHNNLINYTWAKGYVLGEDVISVAEAFRSLGLQQLGYTRMNLDDCIVVGRNGTTHELIPGNYDHWRSSGGTHHTPRLLFLYIARPLVPAPTHSQTPPLSRSASRTSPLACARVALSLGGTRFEGIRRAQVDRPHGLSALAATATRRSTRCGTRPRGYRTSKTIHAGDPMWLTLVRVLLEFTYELYYLVPL